MCFRSLSDRQAFGRSVWWRATLPPVLTGPLTGLTHGRTCASPAGRKQLARALELFLQGLTAPTAVCSAIAAATYKKYVLVSLIHTGAVKALPRFTSQKVGNILEACQQRLSTCVLEVQCVPPVPACALTTTLPPPLRRNPRHHAPSLTR